MARNGSDFCRGCLMEDSRSSRWKKAGVEAETGWPGTARQTWRLESGQSSAMDRRNRSNIRAACSHSGPPLQSTGRIQIQFYRKEPDAAMLLRRFPFHTDRAPVSSANCIPTLKLTSQFASHQPNTCARTLHALCIDASRSMYEGILLGSRKHIHEEREHDQTPRLRVCTSRSLQFPKLFLPFLTFHPT